MKGPRTGSLAVAAALLLAANAAEAAEQGSMGATSSGSITITVSIGTQASVSGVKDIAFASTAPVAGARASEDICLWSNSAAGAYTITASGSGSGGAFQLTNDERGLGYSVAWVPLSGQVSGDPLASGPAGTNLQAAATRSDCASGTGSVSLVVAMDPAQLATTEPSAPYTGSLMLMVAPQ
jgi:hypothetical protein